MQQECSPKTAAYSYIQNLKNLHVYNKLIFKIFLGSNTHRNVFKKLNLDAFISTKQPYTIESNE